MTAVAASSLMTAALVAASLILFATCFWSAWVLAGRRSAVGLAALGLGIGWFAEQMGSSRGWFFGRYSYTDVLGPALGNVPLVIPLMWFALCWVGFSMASLILWRQPARVPAGWPARLLTAWLAAMVVTAFDLGADPYFVFVLKAWIMQKTDGGWFGETLQGFVGWMLVSFAIITLYQTLFSPAQSADSRRVRIAALLPMGVYASGLVFQLLFGQPIEVRAVAFFAMGLPVLVALVAWWQWQHPQAASAGSGASATHPVGPAGTSPAMPALDEMTRVADPLADRTVAALIGPWSDASGAMGPGLARLATATRLMGQWRDNAGLADWQPAEPSADPEVVAVLREYLREGCRLPAWTDAAQVTRAEDIFMQEGPLSCTLLFCASLPQCYVPPDLAQVLHVAGQLEAHTEHRVRQTAAMVFPVMFKGGLTSPGGSGVAQVLKVRLIHATIRHLILHGDPAQVRGPVAAGPRSNDQGLHAALMAHGWDVEQRGLPCNQFELAYTLLTFNYVFLQGMRTMGLGLRPADEAAFLHAWNVAGHVLGVRDDLMAHSFDEAASMFARMQAFGCARDASPDVRPALGQALVQAMARSIRLPVIRGIPVPLTHWLIGPDAARAIGIEGMASWPTRLVFALGRALTRVVDGMVRLVVPQFSISRMLTRVIGYHLLSRFLLDQTRPLTLPEHVLNPMRDTVAQWHHDPRAPGWLNRLEDAWTTTGPWTGHGSTAGNGARPT
jgi:uncharacterized membrane protein